MISTYYLHFRGSISDKDRRHLPEYGGVYLVYRGVWSEKDRLFYCHEIIYIGKAENLRQRHIAHERRADFLSSCHPGEVLFYSFAEVPNEIINRVEAALIYHSCPSLNDSGKELFPYDSTHIISDGACALLDKDILIENDYEH